MKECWREVNWKLDKKKNTDVYESKLLKLNSDKAKKILNWKSVMNFKETTLMTIEWYRTFYNNSKNIRDYSISSLRRNIAFVSQDVHLFSDTILNNITLQNNNISFLRVKDAAKDIKIDDFISSLPNGYNYDVKERGVGLSTGQRQFFFESLHKKSANFGFRRSYFLN